MKIKKLKMALREHTAPEWFEDAKLGIFIHWGLYSVPAWAIPVKDLKGIPEDHAHSPYAEWYGNTVKIKGSPTWEHHRKEYGEDFSYDDFAPIFLKESQSMDPEEWAEFIELSGARYTIFTSKHHDGFTLYPSAYPNPHKKNWGSQRDFPGELASALRKRDIKPGLYYSGIWDWSFQPKAIEDEYSMLTNGDGSREYGDYCFNQFKEIIDRYKPEVLYNDIGYPVRGRLEELLTHYYKTVPEGVANNRWIRWRIPDNKFIRLLVKGILKLKDKIFKVDWGGTDLKIGLGDYATPEFLTLDHIPPFKWECTRGLGSSFGYNRLEDEDLLLSGDELIRLFVDIVSKNGNLAINIGPRADGSIPGNQQKPLLALGSWLKNNGEAIYGSRPWNKAEGQSECGLDLRFTQKQDYLFIFFMDTGAQKRKSLSIASLDLHQVEEIHICDDEAVEMNWDFRDNSLHIQKIPDTFWDKVIPVLKLKIRK